MVHFSFLRERQRRILEDQEPTADANQSGYQRVIKYTDLVSHASTVVAEGKAIEEIVEASQSNAKAGHQCHVMLTLLILVSGSIR